MHCLLVCMFSIVLTIHLLYDPCTSPFANLRSAARSTEVVYRKIGAIGVLRFQPIEPTLLKIYKICWELFYMTQHNVPIS